MAGHGGAFFLLNKKKAVKIMKIELKVKNVCSHSHFPKLIQWDGLESLPGSSVPWALCLTPMTLSNSD